MTVVGRPRGKDRALQALLAAAADGDALDVTPSGDAPGDGHVVPAEALRTLCRTPADQLDPRGIRLRGALVQGLLDLSHVALDVPLLFDDCTFTDAPLLEQAAMPALARRRDGRDRRWGLAAWRSWVDPGGRTARCRPCWPPPRTATRST